MKLGVHQIVLAGLMMPAPPAAANLAQRERTKAQQTSAVAELALGQRLDDNAVVVKLGGKPCELQELLGKATVINCHTTQSNGQRNADDYHPTLPHDHAKHGVIFVHINSNGKERVSSGGRSRQRRAMLTTPRAMARRVEQVPQSKDQEVWSLARVAGRRQHVPIRAANQ